MAEIEKRYKFVVTVALHDRTIIYDAEDLLGTCPYKLEFDQLVRNLIAEGKLERNITVEGPNIFKAEYIFKDYFTYITEYLTTPVVSNVRVWWLENELILVPNEELAIDY